MNRRLLALYPRGWRDRYGAEVAELADELIAVGETTPRRAVLDLLAGAAAERWRVAGAEILKEPVDQPYGVREYGAREYGARDPEGQLWYFHSPLA